MQKKWGYSFALFFAVLTAIFFFFLFVFQSFNRQNHMEKANEALVQNELSQLVQLLRENPNDERVADKIDMAILNIGDAAGIRPNQFLFLFAGMGLLAVYIGVVFFWTYMKIVRPFRRLEEFSKEIAKGNFSSPLPVERTNLFGAFAWAFDSMRTELDFARKEEENARENNKILIATISHDIKTPISSIRAYAEALQYNMDAKEGRREKYLGVIIQKADEVATLTNDLFLHALSDMEKLEMKPEEIHAPELFAEALEPYRAQFPQKVKIMGEIPAVSICADPGRTMQVIDNIVMNAVKYAPESNIEISFFKSEACFVMRIRDFGEGIPPEDMPFVCNKLYRGKNAGLKPGAGLGLYIAKDIMERSKGQLTLANSENGVVVELSFPCAVLGA